ncbi:DUF3291 domain-containing protein (plasmid) [Leisingera sp. S132]|uniref:DUF3291 domain-containing protein n=1 Tax=Leisingera sp. S132 TaxID=2867016 RepID=UPI0021A6FA88|nr:DUF3291 domain-containing protein [Leisingera sp. S132]UWQ81386.1 DUF3291 domain-containing protein [Leisingera sp. S132]
MAIAQMNWGQMLHPLDHPDMAEFNAALDRVYAQAEAHSGFLWRIGEEEAAAQLQALGCGSLISATVSVWDNLDSLRDYTFNSEHGLFLDRKSSWFDTVEGPQLVIWDVAADARPTFREAFERLEALKANGPSPAAYGWT